MKPCSLPPLLFFFAMATLTGGQDHFTKEEIIMSTLQAWNLNTSHS